MIQTKTTRSFFFVWLAATAGLACSRPGGPSVTKEFGKQRHRRPDRSQVPPAPFGRGLPGALGGDPPGNRGDRRQHLLHQRSLADVRHDTAAAATATGRTRATSRSPRTRFSSQVTQMVLRSSASRATIPTAVHAAVRRRTASLSPQRGPDDPVRVLAKLLQLWIAQGDPPGSSICRLRSAGPTPPSRTAASTPGARTAARRRGRTR